MNNPRQELYDYLYPRSKKLKEILVKEINAGGKITFARFMEIVLYHPTFGYYFADHDPYDDYLTSPRFHEAFGKMISKRLLKIWHDLDCPHIFHIVEMGSGDGLLCRQILKFAEEFNGEFYRAIRYVILSINYTGNLHDMKEKVSICTYKDLKIPLKNITGCFLSNELPDAFPVHLVCMDEGEVREIFVSLSFDELTEIKDFPSTHEIKEYFLRLGLSLPEGNRCEINLPGLKWMREIARSLTKGYVMTIDYGYDGRELFSKKDGTLLCFYQHTFNSKPFKRIGYQDMTTHVNFTTLIREGEQSGLIVEEYTTQRDFLLSLGIEKEMESMDKSSINLEDYNAHINNLARLTDPRGLGKVKVLIQKKNIR